MSFYRNHLGIRQAVNALRAGTCIAYPTEGVWGLGCDPENTQAIRALIKLKSRPPEKGLILVSGQVSDFDYLLDGLTDQQRSRILASWPGHTTWLLPHAGRVSPWVSGISAKVAVRVSTHPVIKAICDRFAGPIVSTSANPASLPAAENAITVRRYFKHAQLHYAPGRTAGMRRASRIIDAITGDIHRT